jgi:four helix bundle protein
MQYRRFEDLPVWREAADLAHLMFEFTALDQFRSHPGLRDQLERAALSVSNNIAEGFERGTTNELLAFLYIARGSAGEVRSMLRVLETWDTFANCKSQISNLR